MSLLLLLRRRAQANSGHAEFECTTAVGFGRVTIPSQVVAAILPQRIPIRGTGAADFPATEACGHGRLTDDTIIRLLMSAA